MRTVLSTPTPKVLAWDSRAERNAVGAEYIIMEKAEGVPLATVWETLGGAGKVKVLLQVSRFMTTWLTNPLPGYGGLYYADDVPSELSLPVVGTQYDVPGESGFGTMMAGNNWNVIEVHVSRPCHIRP